MVVEAVYFGIALVAPALMVPEPPPLPHAAPALTRFPLESNFAQSSVAKEPVVVAIVAVRAGRLSVTVPNAPVTGETVIVPEVAFLKSTLPTDVPATPSVNLLVPSVMMPATTFVSTVPAPSTTEFEVRLPPVLVTVPVLAHVASPRQNVVDDALVPLLRWET